MERDAAARKRFAARKWDSLEAMVEDYAREAVTVARADFHKDLMETPAALDRLESILNRLSPAPGPLSAADSEWLTLLWGSWFGEFLRNLHGGAWAMTLYPGTDFSVPTLELPNGSRLYPTMKVHRRLTLGVGESLPAFHAMLVSRLGTSSVP